MVSEGGTVDWPKTMESLQTLDADCPLLLELKDVGMEHPLEHVRKVFERLEAIESSAQTA
jgi:L-ribulose-5-phosphate 3-epimerase UlaE